MYQGYDEPEWKVAERKARILKDYEPKRELIQVVKDEQSVVMEFSATLQESVV